MQQLDQQPPDRNKGSLCQVAQPSEVSLPASEVEMLQTSINPASTISSEYGQLWP